MKGRAIGHASEVSEIELCRLNKLGKSGFNTTKTKVTGKHTDVENVNEKSATRQDLYS